MKLTHLSALMLVLASPVAIFAISETDQKIDDAATNSYNYRVVLSGHIKANSDGGVVTLTGTAKDSDQSDLAQDTALNLPGVLSVNNQITIETPYKDHSDGWMAMKIRGSLLMNSNVSATNTDVSVKDGFVTLTGRADSLAQKELTTVYAQDIEGVKQVDNQTVLNEGAPVGGLSVSIDDASITSLVKYALLTHRATSAIKTKVTTINGVVHISGEAKSDAERALVTKLAADVRGTKSVSNEMTIQS